MSETVMTVIDEVEEYVDAPEVLGHIKDKDVTKSYVLSAGRHALLSATEEVSLSRQIEAGVIAADKYEQMGSILSPKLLEELEVLVSDGIDAKTRMILSNLGLVMSSARGYIDRGVDYLDLVQYGNTGLMHAVEMYDYTKGFKFSTYAMNWIRQSIHRGIAVTGRTIRVPIKMHETVAKVYGAMTELQGKLHREPTQQEIAGHLGVSVNQVEKALQVQNNLLSLDMPIGNDDSVLADIVGSFEASDIVHAPVEQQEIVAGLDRKMQLLNRDESIVLTYVLGLFGVGKMPTDDIATLLGITKPRVYNLTGSAMSKLSHPALRVHDVYTPDQEWRDDALCAEVGLDLFYPEKGGSTRGAKQVCGKCDVKAECLEFALEAGDKHGVWGGLSDHERRKL